MGVTPIYHFDYTKNPFKFKVSNTPSAGLWGIRMSAYFLDSPNGSMTWLRLFFKMCLKEGEAVNQQPH